LKSLTAGDPAIGTAVCEDDGLISAYVGPANMPLDERQAIWRSTFQAIAAIVDASRAPTQIAAE